MFLMLLDLLSIAQLAVGELFLHHRGVVVEGAVLVVRLWLGGIISLSLSLLLLLLLLVVGGR